MKHNHAFIVLVYAGLVNSDKVAVMGGSHGGFLTGNLVGQYPDAFKCGVLRNPVMDLGLMIHCSDIPDWTYVEAFGSKVPLPLWHRLLEACL